MNILMNLYMLPLQTFQMSDFWKSKGRSSADLEVFVVGFGIVILLLIIINILRIKIKNFGVQEGRAPSNKYRQYSSFTLHQLTQKLGLNREQTKMLDYVLKSGGVKDPAHVLNSPSLVDRHFKRTYRIIETSGAGKEEINSRLAILFSTRNIIENHANKNRNAEASTRYLPENAAAMLTVGKVNYPVRVVSSAGDMLIVETPKSKAGNPVLFAPGSRADFSFFSKGSKGFSVETHIVGSQNTRNGPVLQLAHSSHVQKLSKRRSRRRQSLISTSFYFVHAGKGRFKKKLIADQRRFSGNIIDISSGGCSLKTATPVKAGQKIKVEFTLDDNSVINAVGEILRTSRAGTNTVMHLKFLKVPRRSLNAINAMIYEYADE